MAHHPSTSSNSNSALRALTVELKHLHSEPVEGFTVTANDENLFEWTVAIFGPPKTLYEGGYFKASLRFPTNYPYSPPAMRFLTKVWHPNVYENGDLCISILHPPVDDPHSGEMACERWNPTQSVRTILMSVISLLNEPNTSSPANVDASVMFRKWKESNGVHDEYAKVVRKQCEHSRLEADRDGVVVPCTVEEYCVKAPKQLDPFDSLEFDDDYYDYGDDDDMSDEEEEEEAAEVEECDQGEDSGQGEDS
jgi:ubiquitin-conjugating enzyme E2 R